MPFAKVGLDYAYWQNTDGNDNIATDPSGGHGQSYQFRLTLCPAAVRVKVVVTNHCGAQVCTQSKAHVYSFSPTCQFLIDLAPR